MTKRTPTSAAAPLVPSTSPASPTPAGAAALVPHPIPVEPVQVSATPAPTRARTLPGELAGNVFLSPRVVDREAFADFAGSLRGLVQNAADGAATLAAATEEAKAVAEKTQSVLSKHAPRIEAAAKLIATVDAKAAAAEKVVERAAAASEELRRFEAASAKATDEASKRLETRLADMMAGAERRFKEFEARAAERFAELEARTLRAIEDAAAAAERPRALIAELDAVAARARESVAALEAAITDSQERLTNLPGAVNARATELMRAAEERIAAAEARLAQLPHDADEAVNPVLERLRDASGRADEIRATLERLDAAQEAAENALTQFDAIKDQAVMARKILGESLIEATEAVDRIADVATTITQRAQAAVDEMQRMAGDSSAC